MYRVTWDAASAWLVRSHALPPPSVRDVPTVLIPDSRVALAMVAPVLVPSSPAS